MSEYIVEVNGPMPDAIYERETTELTRCRDCRHNIEGLCFAHPCEVCEEPRHVEPDGYCHKGERREP